MRSMTWLARALLGLGALLAAAAALAVPADHPLADFESHIVPVAQWGGTPADPALARLQTITHITLHHQGEPFPIGHALIEVVGNFEEVQPNQDQLDAVVELMAMLAAKYQVPVTNISGHKDYSAQTVCPGANLYRYLQNGYFREQVASRLKQR
jgi:hypothetical protein